MNDIFYMQRAIELAAKGWGKTRPNPLVGAVIVKEDRIIGEGWHQELGGPHAEINAIRNAKEDVAGATIYVNLEPCSHYGRTPPCAEALIERKFKRVVIAMEDPNPLVAGSGIEMLRQHGIEAEVGLEKLEALKLNDVFIKHITQQAPFVHLKYAMTLDGKTATKIGDSKWISSEASREYVHLLRSRYAAILVGVNTVLKDDPELTARPIGMEGRNPVRVILDSEGRIPENARVLDTGHDKKTIVAMTERVKADKRKRLAERGIEIILTDEMKGRVNIGMLLKELYKRGIDSLLVEGGGTVAASFIEGGYADKLTAFVAPVVIGGTAAPTPVMGDGVEKIKQGVRLTYQQFRQYEGDCCLEGYLKVPWEMR